MSTALICFTAWMLLYPVMTHHTQSGIELTDGDKTVLAFINIAIHLGVAGMLWGKV